VLSISTTLSGVILHAKLFVTGQLRNPWQMLAEPLGSIKTSVENHSSKAKATEFGFKAKAKDCHH